MKNLIPMNLQFFAEEPSTSEPSEPTPATPDVSDAAESPKEDSKPSDLDVNAQLQTAMVEIAKLKRAQEKAASQAAEYKKKWQETLSEQEKASMEKAEAQAKKEEEFEAMRKKLAINDLTEHYMDRKWPKDIAQKAAVADYDGDRETVNLLEKQMDEVKRKQWLQEELARRPDVNVGSGSDGTTYTKEQFDKMTMIERTKLKRENEAEYRRLLAL